MSVTSAVHIAVRPGAGIVARSGVGLLVMQDGGSDAVRAEVLEAFQTACADNATPGRMMARRLVGLLSQSEPDDVPAFGACAPNERGWAVILHQGVALHVQQGTMTLSLSGYDASTWVDRIVEDGFESLTLMADGAELGEIDTRFRFDGGIIPGGGATILPATGLSAPATAVPAAPPASEPSASPVGDAPAMDQPSDGQSSDGHPPAAPSMDQPAPAPAPASAPAPAAAAPPAADTPGPAPVAAPAAPPAAAAPAPAAPAVMPVVMPTPTADPVQQPATSAASTETPPQAVAAPSGMTAAEMDEAEPPTLIQSPDRSAEPGAPAEPEDMPEEDVPFESVPLVDIGADARRDPLPVLSADTPKEEVEDAEAPLVYGVLSPAGYFNHPDALYCAVTGVSMLHRTHVLVQRARPPLGVVVADDGSTYTLSKNYIVGREPERDPAVEADEARPLKLQDAERSLSRVHAEIRLVDWDVFIVDRASANGTYVLPRGAQQWKRLVADTPEKIVPGTRVAFGKRVITFESHHQINQQAAS